MKNIILFICVIFNLNTVFAVPNPAQPGQSLSGFNNGYSENLFTNPVSIIKLNNRYLIASLYPTVANGSLFGVYDPANQSANRMTISGSYGQGPDSRPAVWSMGINTGTIAYLNSDVVQLTKPGMIIDPGLPFAWGNTEPGVSYNNFYYVSANLDRYPRGMQVGSNEVAKIASWLINNHGVIPNNNVLIISYDVARTVSPTTIASLESELASAGYFASRTRFYSTPVVNVNPSFDTGTVTMSPTGNILTIPVGCSISPSKTGMVCPFNVTTIPNAFTILTNKSSEIAFTTSATSTTEYPSIQGGQANTWVYYKAAWFTSKLAGANETTVMDTKSLKIQASSSTFNSTFFDAFNLLNIKKIIYSVGIKDRNSAGSTYSGVVGSSNIVIPYEITQQGSSMATTINVTVSSLGNINGKCIFIAPPVQSIAIPLSLAFSSPGSLSKTAVGGVNCSGLSPVDIVNMPWVGGVDVTGMYSSSLWMDMIFNLTTPAVMLDTSGKNWNGIAAGSGTITVNAIWN